MPGSANAADPAIRNTAAAATLQCDVTVSDASFWLVPHTQPVARRRVGAEGRSSRFRVPVFLGGEIHTPQAGFHARLVNFGLPDWV